MVVDVGVDVVASYGVEEGWFVGGHGRVGVGCVGVYPYVESFPGTTGVVVADGCKVWWGVGLGVEMWCWWLVHGGVGVFVESGADVWWC